MSLSSQILSALLFLTSFPSSWAAVPAAPTNLRVTPLGTADQVLAWADVSTDETGFTIERLDGASWVAAGTAAANSSTTILRNQPSGVQTYRISAVNVDGSSVASAAASTLRMNVLFFLADDFGYKDIVANRNPATDGPTIYETPAADQLKFQSMSFRQASCSGPKCVVARRALMTGMLDFRSAAVAQGGGIGPEMVTIGEAMKAGGYRTGYIGKWHLGGVLASPLTPHGDPVYETATPEALKVPGAQGFDVSIAAGEYGAPPLDPGLTYNPQSGGYFPVTIAGSSPAEYWYGLPNLYTSNPSEYLTDRLTTEATGFMGSHISSNPTQPFFLILAHYAVHTPLQADPARVAYYEGKRAAMAAQFAAHPSGGNEFKDDFTSHTRMHQDQPVYAAMIDGFDDSLAAIRSYLAATSDPRNPGKTLAETTIIILSSDHGGKSTHALTDANNDNIPTSNYPFRQGKTWCYEGGLRIPLIVYWPGFTPTGAESDALVNGADLYTSILDMTGSPRVPTQHLDSISFAEVALNPAVRPRTENIHYFTNADDGTGNPAMAACRSGDYKLIYHIIRRVPELYDLAEDIGEQHNLASLRPDLVSQMLSRIHAKRDEVGEVPPKPGTNSWNTELLVLGTVMSIPPIPNGAPSGLVASVVSDTAVDLRWTDGSTNEERFVIQRKLSGSGAFTEFATVTANATRFRDTGLTPGQTYQYRIQAETLGGWNATPSNTVSITPGGTAALPVIARGDYVTDLKNEVRVFEPLANDQGRLLTITGITQPGKGLAEVLNGTQIRFTPTLNATGLDQMSYTAMDSAGVTATGVIRLNILASHALPPVPTYDLSPIKSLVDAWEFNEANNITLANCTNSAVGSTLKFTGTTPKTNGSGSLVIVTSGAAGNTFRTTGSVTPGAKTLGVSGAGVYEMTVRFTAANLAGGDADGAYAGTALRDKTSLNDLFGVRLQEAAGKLELQLRNPSPIVLYTFPGNTLTAPTEVKCVADLAAKTVAVYYTVASSEVLAGTFPMDPAALVWNDYRIAASNNNTDFGAADFIEIDFLRIKSVVSPTPPTPLQVWLDTANSSAASSSKLPLSDPDADGQLNLTEFALGTAAFANDGASPLFTNLYVTGAPAAPVQYLALTLPVKDGATFPGTASAPLMSSIVDGIRYCIESSTDLISFNVPVEEIFPAQESGLPPVTPGWSYRSYRSAVPQTGGPQRGFIRANFEMVP